jgi:peptide/nickel transport system substrate-binding protein
METRCARCFGQRPPVARRAILRGAATGGAGLAAALAAACGGDEKPAASPPVAGSTGTQAAGTAAAAAGPPSGTLRISQGCVSVQVDPARRQSVCDSQLTYQIYDTLFHWEGESGVLIPDAALSWESPDGGVTWIYKLRPGMKHHDGSPVKAEDAAFSFERLGFDAGSSVKDVFSGLDRVEVMDDLTFRTILKQPDGEWLGSVYQYAPIYSKAYFQSVGQEGFVKKPIGSGAWKFESFRPDVGFSMTANPDYWGEKPRFERLEVNIVTDPNTLVNQLLAGEIDIAYSISAETREQVEKRKGLRLVDVRDAGNFYFMIQLTKKDGDRFVPDTATPFADKRVRQALNLALDREGLIKTVQRGQATIMRWPVTPGRLGYDASIQPYPYDTRRARQLLQEAGHRDGVGLTLTIAEASRSLAEAIKAMLDAAGFKTTIQLKPQQDIVTAWRNRELQFWSTNFTDRTWDPYTRLQFDSVPQARFGWYEDPKVHQLMATVKPVIDMEKRDALFRELFAYVYEQNYYVTLWHGWAALGMKEEIQYTPRRGWTDTLLDLNKVSRG